jgi:hypothetical protein
VILKMSQSQRTRIARLERRVSRYLAERAEASNNDVDEDGYLVPHRFNYCLTHAVNLAYLARFGDPKVGEPLSDAWKRTGYAGRYDPFDRSGAEMVSKDLLSTVFPGLPGNGIKEKLDLIFETAPAWLIWFTHGDLIAILFDLKFPTDLLNVVKFARPRVITVPALPSGAFEYQPWPEGPKPSCPEEEYLMRKAGIWDNPNMSRRQRGRRSDIESPPRQPLIRWPDALPG